MSVRIKETSSGVVLADSEPGPLRYEGNLYFAPKDVKSDVLKVTERTYTCPMKGTCNWVDFVGPDGKIVKDVAWVYPTTKAGHEAIAGRYGFYAGKRGSTAEESA